MYFQLEVDYYIEASKSKYKNVQLIASTKNKMATDCACKDSLS